MRGGFGGRGDMRMRGGERGGMPMPMPGGDEFRIEEPQRDRGGDRGGLRGAPRGAFGNDYGAPHRGRGAGGHHDGGFND